MFNYYLHERLMEYRQKEIDKKARQAWKWTTMKEERKEIKPPQSNSQSYVYCCPACC